MRPIFMALAFAALAATATAQRGLPTAPHPAPIAPVPIMPVPITPIPITPAPTPIAPLPAPTPLAPVPVAPAPIIVPPPPPACRIRSTGECAAEATSCLAARYIADRYSVQWTNSGPYISPNPESRRDAAEQAADDCADNLRQCLTGGC
jgi:hypothetical protein